MSLLVIDDNRASHIRRIVQGLCVLLRVSVKIIKEYETDLEEDKALIRDAQNWIGDAEKLLSVPLVLPWRMVMVQTITLGEPCEILLTSQPDYTFTPLIVNCNVPDLDMVMIRELLFANHTCLIAEDHRGLHTPDVYPWTAQGCGRSLYNIPVLRNVHRVMVRGTYSGKVPSHLNKGDTFALTFSFDGPTEA